MTIKIKYNCCSAKDCCARTIKRDSDYEHKYGVTCVDCIVAHIQRDGRLMPEIHRDKVRLSIVFGESIFAEECNNGHLLAIAMNFCNYDHSYTESPANEQGVASHYATYTYETPVIRKLMGRKTYADILRTVRVLVKDRMELKIFIFDNWAR